MCDDCECDYCNRTIDSVICYGVLCKRFFPWYEDLREGDDVNDDALFEWWRYKQLDKEIGKDDELPCEEVFISADMGILAVRNKVIRAEVPKTEIFDPAKLIITPQEKELLINFCNKYLNIKNIELKWHLTSETRY